MGQVSPRSVYCEEISSQLDRVRQEINFIDPPVDWTAFDGFVKNIKSPDNLFITGNIEKDMMAQDNVEITPEIIKDFEHIQQNISSEKMRIYLFMMRLYTPDLRAVETSKKYHYQKGFSYYIHRYQFQKHNSFIRQTSMESRYLVQHMLRIRKEVLLFMQQLRLEERKRIPTNTTTPQIKSIQVPQKSDKKKKNEKKPAHKSEKMEKNPSNKGKYEDQIAITQNAETIALQSVKFLFYPLKIQSKAPGSVSFNSKNCQDSRRNEVYSKTLDNLQSEAMELMRSLEEGQFEKASQNVMKSRQLLLFFQDFVRNLIQNLQKQQKNADNVLTKTAQELQDNTKKKSQQVPKFQKRTTCEATSKQSYQTSTKYISFKEKQFKIQNKIVPLQTKQAISSARGTLLNTMVKELKQIQSKFKFLNQKFEDLNQCFELEDPDEGIQTVTAYIYQLEKIQTIANQQLKVEAQHKPNTESVRKIVRQIHQLRSDQWECLYYYHRHCLMRLLIEKMNKQEEEKKKMKVFEQEQRDRKQKWWTSVKKRRASLRSDMFDDMYQQIDTWRTGETIENGFKSAINYAKANEQIVRVSYSWSCGLFYSNSKYDIYLYDDDGNKRKNIYKL